jgi:hypothetical protein
MLKFHGFLNMTFNSGKPYNELPYLPPKSHIGKYSNIKSMYSSQNGLGRTKAAR